ncbi:hypothetical protein GWK26_08610 [haloarchaeon 3A1-DGR]|nr:hypothetical protein GWK26_08610 [haloarchaeon 3A1-DGR]
MVELPGWLSDRKEALTALAAVSATLTAFAEDPRGFILRFIREWLVGLILDGGAFVIGFLSQIGDIAVETYRTGLINPVTDAFVTLGVGVLDSFEGIQASVADSLVGLGIAAPFALLIGFVVAMIAFVILFAALWSLLETYLPMGAIVAPLRTVFSVVTFGRLNADFDGDGETNDQ